MMLTTMSNFPCAQTVASKELPKLEINRHTPPPIVAPKKSKPSKPKDPRQIYTRIFKIISYSCCPPAEGEKSTTKSAKAILEEAGIGFPKGTNAQYNPQMGLLTVSHNAEGMSFVEAYVESISGKAEKYILFQVEIYRLPTALVLQLQESAELHSDHAPERNAVLKLAKQGQVEFVTSINLEARSGQRAKFEDAVEYRYLDHYEWDKNRKKALPVFETRDIGTFFEVDPVLGADEFTLDINFYLEYHTAAPGQKISQVRFPNKDNNISAPLPVFHKESISTSFATITGTTKIIGTFRPTGKPEYQQEGLMDLIFLKSTIMFLKPEESPQ